MKKKTLIIVGVIVAVCGTLMITSHYINWPVDTDQVSGDIAKSNKFSRKTVEEANANMQELLMNDEEYKDGIVMAYAVMQTRAKQFEALVDLSMEAAGDIKEFEPVLNDMKKVKQMVANVCDQMETVGKDLDATLGGEQVEDLAQNTNNAALAYATLQKQNGLADKFIETTDTYLKSASGNDKLKFVRDQWVEYQKMTAALNQDKEAAADLEKKGYKLDEEKSLQMIGSLNSTPKLSLTNAGEVSKALGLGPRVFAQEGLLNDNSKVLNDNSKVLNASIVLNGGPKIVNALETAVSNSAPTVQANPQTVLGAVNTTIAGMSEKNLQRAL
jgi:hypothetical protein